MRELCEDIVCARYDLEMVLFVLSDAMEALHYGDEPDEYLWKDLCYAVNFLQYKLDSRSDLLSFASDDEIAARRTKQQKGRLNILHEICGT